jgi:hypothetical protein
LIFLAYFISIGGNFFSGKTIFMIEGTKPFRKKSDVAFTPEEKKSSVDPRPTATIKPLEEIYPSQNATVSAANAPLDAPNPSRREWFSSLGPAFGSGLVKILRESNHLKRELSEALRPENHQDENK